MRAILRYKAWKLALEIDPLFMGVVFITFVLGVAMQLFVILLSTLLHEIGHMLAAASVNARVCSVRLLPVGFNAHIEDSSISSKQRVFIYICGPLVNLILAAATSVMNSYYPVYPDGMRFFILSNISLLVFNLIPALPLDGGKMLVEMLSARFGLFAADKYLRKLTAFLSVFLTIAGIIQVLNNNKNFSLILIAIYIFFTHKTEERGVALMNMKNVVYRRLRLLKKGIYPARDLVVLKNMHISDLLKELDFDRFHIIHILDDNFAIIKSVTEYEIMEGMLKYSSDVTFDEFLKTFAI